MAYLYILGLFLVGVVLVVIGHSLKKDEPSLERLEHTCLEPRSREEWGHRSSCLWCNLGDNDEVEKFLSDFPEYRP